MSQAATPARQWLALSVLVGAVLLLVIDGTVLYLAVPALTEQLSPTATQILWIGDIYSLALAGLLVTMGNLADRIGRKKLLLMGATAFGLASALAAFSPSASALIGARLLLGIAGATIMPSTLSLIRNIFTDQKQRTKAIAIWSSAISSGVALGPLVGGFLLEHFWWGSVFLINIPVMLVVIIVGYVILPESKDSQPGRFDIVSSILSLLAMTPFVYVIKQIAGGKADLSVIGCAVLGVVAGVLFFMRQRRSWSPMIDIQLFRYPAFTGAVLVNFISIFALSGVLFFLAQYLQLVRGLSPLQAGLAQLPTALAAMGAAALVGLLLTKLGRGRAIACGLTVGVVGMMSLTISQGAGELAWVVLATLPVAFGIGVAETLSVDAVVSAVEADKAGAAASISETAYELGVALGIAVLGSVVAVLYQSGVTVPSNVDLVDAERIKDSVTGAYSVLDGQGAVWESAKDAFVSAVQMTTLIAGAAMIIAAVVSFVLIPNHKNSAHNKS